MTADIEVRTLHGHAEVAEGCAVFWRSMVGLAPLGSIDPVPGTEPGRFLGAHVDGQLVGSANSYDGALTVPGGRRLPHAGVTHVGVLPTHTRRGVLTALMTGQLRDFMARDTVLATLRPVEGGVYGRFGYGVATRTQSARLVRPRARLRPGLPDGGPVALGHLIGARAAMTSIYEPANWLGAITRPPGWWLLRDLAYQEAQQDPYLAVHGAPGSEDGFVAYRPTLPHEWLHSDRRVVVVDDLVANTPSAQIGLLRHLLAIDLVHEVQLPALPVDSPIPLMLADERALKVTGMHDETWLRLIDVGAALAGRTYRDAPAVTIDVVDPMLPANNRSFRVGSSSAGPDLSRPAIEPQLRVGVAELAAAYLGGTSWRRLHAAGRVDELASGAVDAADALFQVPDAPYAGTDF